MMVVDASTLPVVTGWPEKKKSVSHWFQFGGSAAPGFKAFDALYGAPGKSAGADVSPDDPFAVISTAAVDVIPRGAVLTHASVIAANLTPMPAFGLTPPANSLLPPP